MIFRICVLLKLFIIAVISTRLLFGCSGVSRSLNKMVQIREARKIVEKLSKCPEESYPIDKIEIAPSDVKIDFKSICIFNSGTDLGVIRAS